MRLLLAVPLVYLGACSVPDKKPIEPDAGTPGSDAGSQQPPVDGEAPDTTIDESPAEFSASGQVTFRFSSNDPSATFTCLVDKEVAQPCQSPYVRTLSDGAHNFAVRAIDKAGNSDDTPAEHLWTIDTVAPDTMLLDAPPARDNTVMPMFTFKSPEANVAFECALDNAGYLPCESGAGFGPVSDGAHAFAVRARDRAGNVDPSPAVYAWSVDTSTPDTEILQGPAEASRTASPAVSFTFFSPDAGAGATFQCSIDMGAFIACSSPASYAALAEGPHSFAVRVRDAVGNFDPTPADRSWTVDLRPPETTILTGPTGATAAAAASVTFTSNEADSTFTCSLDNAAFAACTSPANFTGLAQGAHSFAVRATDAAAHTDASPAIRSWTVDTVAPNIAITGPVDASTVGPRVVIGFTASEGTIACSRDGAPFGSCTSPIADNLPAGPHQLSVRATDAAGNVTIVVREWTVACSPPDGTGAAGVLHFDEATQSLANAVAGGAAATLGDTPDVEPSDPAPLAAGRFGGAITFMGPEHVTWPAALPPATDLALELWASPSAMPGMHDLVVSSDGRVALRVVGGATVRFTIAVDGVIVTSAAVAANAWHHVLVSLAQPSLRLWVDGARTEVATVQLASPLALDALQLGGNYDGALDELWLSETAIAAGDEPALVRYCPL